MNNLDSYAPMDTLHTPEALNEGLGDPQHKHSPTTALCPASSWVLD